MSELKQFERFEEILLFDGIEDNEELINTNYELSNGLDSFDLEQMINTFGISNFYFKNEDELEIYLDSNNVSLKYWLKLFEYNYDCDCELVDYPCRITNYYEMKDGLFLLEW